MASNNPIANFRVGKTMKTLSGAGTEDNSLSTDARPDEFHQSIPGFGPNFSLEYNGQTGGFLEHLAQPDFNQSGLDQFRFDQIDQAEQGQITPLTSFLMDVGYSDLDLLKSANNTPKAVVDDSFLSTPASQPQVASPDMGTPCLSPSRPGPSSKGTKWTEEMNAFFLERKNMGETHKVIAAGMQEQFGVYVNPNILSKQYKKIAEQEAKQATLYKAILNATPRIKSLVEDELDKLCAGDASELVKAKQDMDRQLPDLLQSLTAKLWRQSQSQPQPQPQARGA